MEKVYKLYKHFHAIFIIEYRREQYVLNNSKKEHILKFALEHEDKSEEYCIKETLMQFIDDLNLNIYLNESRIASGYFILLDQSLRIIKDEVYYTLYLKFDINEDVKEAFIKFNKIDFKTNYGVFSIYENVIDEEKPIMVNLSKIKKAKYDLEVKGNTESDIIKVFDITY